MYKLFRDSDGDLGLYRILHIPEHNSLVKYKFEKVTTAKTDTELLISLPVEISR